MKDRPQKTIKIPTPLPILDDEVAIHHEKCELLQEYRKATKDLGIAMLNFNEIYLEGEDHHEIRIARENVKEILKQWLITAQKVLTQLD